MPYSARRYWSPPPDSAAFFLFRLVGGLFASGLGVEETDRRLREGWTFRKTRLSEQYDLEAARGDQPAEAAPLMLVRQNGKLHFFSHASWSRLEPGDTVVSFGPPREPAKTRPRPKAADTPKGDEDMTTLPSPARS